MAKLTMCSLYLFLSLNVCFSQTNKEKKIEEIKINLAKAKELFTTNRTKGELLAIEVFTDASTFKETIGEYIDAHNLLGLFATYTDRPTKAMKYYTDGLKLAIENNNVPLTQKLKTNIGNHYMYTGKYTEAIEYITNLLNSLKDNKLATAQSLANIAVCYSYLTEDSLAILYQNKAIELFEETKNTRGLSTGYNLLGVSYTSLKNYDLANSYLLKSLDFKKKLQDSSGIITALINIGTNYYKVVNYQATIQTFKLAEAYLINYKSNHHSSSLYNNISTYYEKIEKYDSSLYYNYKALQAVQNTKNLYLHANILRNLSRGYNKIDNPDSALAYLLQANILFDSLNNIEKLKQVKELSTKYETEKKQLQINLLAKQDSLKGLTIVQQQLSITNNLLKISNQNLALSKAGNQLIEDSLQLAKKEKQLLSSKIETQQKEEKITLLNKEKQIQNLAVKNKNYAIAGVSTALVLLSFAGIGYFRNYKLQQQKIIQAKLHQQQQQATIDILTAEEKERKRIAGDLHDGIGQTMMAAWLNLQAIQNNTANQQEKELLLQKAMLLVDESCKDVRSVSHNMMPNALLKKGLVNAVKEFINQIDKNIIAINVHSEGLQKELPAVTETILYRVIQESVNNVVKHANASLLDISILNEPDGIDVLIEDNGKGFNVAKALQQQGGLGLNNIKSRIEYLKGTVDWSSTANSGTLVAIHIPV